MSMEAWLRVISVLLFLVICVALPAGVASAIVDIRRIDLSTTHPTPLNTEAFNEHGQTLYCTATMMRLFQRIHAIAIPATIIMLVLFAIRGLMIRLSARSKSGL
jgi:hypothetical protein